MKTMSKSKFTTYEFEFTESEREHLEATAEIIKDVIHTIGDVEGISEIVNIETCEIIFIKDLYRMRGIISGLLNQYPWKAEK